uniref:Glycoprotein 120 n=1 Tax=Caenorhabditis tropicalis TaxID=1561998 RepID=A0A1I7U9Z9_9PELO
MVLFLPIFLSIISLIKGASSLDCYKYTGYENRVVVKPNNTHCTAFFETATGDATFSGAHRTPDKMTETIKKMRGRDCRHEKHRNHNGEPFIHVYICLCFTPMCNFPFTYEEFAFRGFTIAPTYTKNEDLW